MFIVVLGLSISCKSAPKPAPETEPPAVQETEQETQPAHELPEVTEVTPSPASLPDDTVVSSASVEEELLNRQQNYNELAEVLTAARAKRQEIMNDGYYEDNSQTFDDADSALKRASEAYDAGFEAVDENALNDGRFALEKFTAIIDGVWTAKVDDLRKTSENLQQQALKLRADAAVKENYNFAVELHNKGGAAARGGDYLAAINFYNEAIPAFTETIKIAAQKKEKAELALKNAEQKIIESEKLVEDAVKFLENSTNEKGDVL
jgi:tetratricopeptide (TPR) repeat protein